MDKRLIGKTRNGVDVYAINGHEHMDAHECITDAMLKEALKLVNYAKPFYMESVDVGHIVGKDYCVSVSAADDVRFLYRKGRRGKTPIVFGREAPETSLITIGIRHDNTDGLETIFTAFTGAKAPKEPWDSSLKTSFEREESARFWGTHALVYNKHSIDPDRNY